MTRAYHLDIRTEKRATDPSFQLAHAVYSLERMLLNFISRGAVFDVVFFHGELIRLLSVLHVLLTVSQLTKL
jgi:hypothetical protein